MKKIAPVEIGEGDMLEIEIEEDLLKANMNLANANRKWFTEHRVEVIDVLGSIGSGKTELIIRLIDRLKGRRRIGVVAGDVTTTIDAERISSRGVPTIQLNTGRECHLDALMIKKIRRRLNIDDLDLLLIENVGNLICPADFPLGAHKRLVVVSVTEGPYMIVKHPLIFRDADMVVINKIDLAEAMEVNPDKLAQGAKEINPRIRAVKTSMKTGEGVGEVIEALGL